MFIFIKLYHNDRSKVFLLSECSSKHIRQYDEIGLLMEEPNEKHSFIE